MRYITEQIAQELQTARKKRGLSQRALGARVGAPQSHISKIESNAVDLRLSSLLALAHALDFEILLVPRAAVPAVRAITQTAESAGESGGGETQPRWQPEGGEDDD